MSDYKLDRTAFRIQTHDEEERSKVFDKDTPYSERLRQAYYLISQAYGFSIENEPRLDKSYFRIKKREP